MRARLHDPAGRRYFRRWAPVGLGAGLAVTAITMAFAWGHGLAVAVLVALSGLLAAHILAWPLFELRDRPRDVELELAPGRMRIRARGLLPRTVHARDVLGASTALLGDGISLALVLRPAHTAPMLLRLPDEASADAVRKALGIGPGGLGVLRWRTVPSRPDVARRWVQALWRIGLLLTVFLLLSGGEAGVAGLAAEFAVFFGLASLLARLRPITGGPCLEMAPDGAYGLRSGKKGALTTARVPYGAIRTVHVGHDGIRLLAAPPHGTVFFPAPTVRGLKTGVDNEEKDHIAAQLVAAAQRAKQPAIVDGSWARLEPLRRGGQALRAWLARLDAVAQSLQGAHDYRSALPDEQELWSALEAPDADPELRTAAARVLFAHDRENTRKRVADVLAACRDPRAIRRIRIALQEDVEEAALELEDLEEPEAFASARTGSRTN